MNCNFQDTCSSNKAERVWASLGDTRWLGIFLCDECFHLMGHSSIRVTKEPPTEQWVKQLFDDVKGEDDEKRYI